MLQAKISCFVNAGSLSVMFNLIWKHVQNGNENDTDGAVDFFVVLYVNYGCFK